MSELPKQAQDHYRRASFLSALTRLFSVQVIGLGAGFIVHLALARILAPAEYGTYNFIFSLAMLAALVGNFGFQASSVRLIPQFMSDQKHSWITRFFMFSALWVFAFSCITALAVFGGLPLPDIAGDDPRSVLLAGGALTVLIALIKLNSGILKGFKKGGWALAYESGLKEIIFLLVVLGGALAGLQIEDAKTALWVVSAIFGVLVIASFTHIIGIVKTYQHDGERITRSSYGGWLRLSFPMMLVISAQVIIHRSDIVVLGFMSEALDVGVYSAGAKIAQAATIGVMALNIIFSPRASEAFHKNKTGELRGLYFKTMRYQAGATIVLGVALAVLAPYILNYLGGDYGAALPVLYVLMAGYALNTLWGPVPFLMIMTKFEYQAMWMTFAAAVLNIGLNIVLIPLYGIVGAAIATIAALNMRNAGAFLYVMSQGLLSRENTQ